MNSMLKCMALAAAGLTAVAAQAGPITSDTLGPQVTFDTASAGFVSGAISGSGMTLSGGVNSTGNFPNGLSYLDAYGPIRLDFASAVTGFGFQFVSNNVDVLVSAYDGSDNLLESDVFSIAGLSLLSGYPTGYAGIDGLSGIDHAIITTTMGHNSIYVGPVNAATGAVPEPASWALMLGGFGLVGGAMRSRKRTAVSFG